MKLYIFFLVNLSLSIYGAKATQNSKEPAPPIGISSPKPKRIFFIRSPLLHLMPLIIKDNKNANSSINEKAITHSCNIDACRKSFNTKKQLQQHKRTHSNERPYRCTFPSCGKAYKFKHHLTRHIPVHANIKPSKCQTCGMFFNRSDNLKRHVKNQHSTDLQSQVSRLD